MNYNNEKLKTTGESIQYLNSIIFGMSSTNGVIPKAYNSPYAIQSRLEALEDQGVPLVILDEVQQALLDLNAAVDNLETDVALLILQTKDSGWQPVPDPIAGMDSTFLFIRRIGRIVNIQGYAFVGVGLPANALLFTLPVGYVPQEGLSTVGHYGQDEVTLNLTSTGVYIRDAILGGDDLYLDFTYMTEA